MNARIIARKAQFDSTEQRPRETIRPLLRPFFTSHSNQMPRT